MELPMDIRPLNLDTRINKYLSQVGFCSRREADKLIDQGSHS